MRNGEASTGAPNAARERSGAEPSSTSHRATPFPRQIANAADRRRERGGPSAAERGTSWVERTDGPSAWATPRFRSSSGSAPKGSGDGVVERLQKETSVSDIMPTG